MRCESADESARVRVWSVIYATDDGLVRLNVSIGSTKVTEVLLRELSVILKSVHKGTLKARPPTSRTYLICPVQSVPAYPFAKGGQPHLLRRVESGVYITYLGYPSWVFKSYHVTRIHRKTMAAIRVSSVRLPQATPRWTGQRKSGGGMKPRDRNLTAVTGDTP